MDQFEVHRNDTTNELRVRVAARKFDLGLAPAFREAVEPHLSEDLSGIWIDFSKVEFIDSSGVGALVRAHKKLSEDAAVTIAHPCPAVLAIIEMLRLHRVFRLELDGPSS